MRNLQLLRSRAYISDATMELTPDSLDSTRVVVTLRSRDSWTISADAALHGEGRTMIGLSDANIFGSGNRLSVATNFSRNDFGYGGNVVSYDIPNFLGSFYKANFSAGRDFYNSELRIGVGKEFILPTDYELGIAYNNVKAKYYLVDRDTSDLAKSKRFDVWAGAFALHSFDPFERLPHGALRFRALLAPSRRDEDLQPGFSRYRRRAGRAGALPREVLHHQYDLRLRYEGVSGHRLQGRTGRGYSWREFGEDMYMGLSYKAGGFTRAGYLMGGFSLGSFIDLATGQWTQSAVDVNLRWFSPLFVWKRSHIRQFLSLNYTQGWNRLEGSDEVLRFTAQDGLSLLKEDLVGTNRMVLNTETVFFTPYQPLGFRIALFGFADFGLLGRDANIFKNNFYTTFGLGVRLRNERLVFSTIQLRLGVALGKGGWADCRYFQASNGTRMEQYRYLPSRPEIVRFR